MYSISAIPERVEGKWARKGCVFLPGGNAPLSGCHGTGSSESVDWAEEGVRNKERMSQVA